MTKMNKHTERKDESGKKEMRIKDFVEKYNVISIESLKDDFIKDNIEIVNYIPFIKKDALAEKLINVSTYEYEDYTDESGKANRRKTDNIKINSVIQYLLFCRIIIENYTNLEVETDGFYEEYDALKQSGLLDKLMVGTENRPSLIPMEEIVELRSIIDMKSRDVMTNYVTPQAYISNQVERFGTLLSVALKPVLDKIATSIENMDEKDIEKFGNKIEKALKRVK